MSLEPMVLAGLIALGVCAVGIVVTVVTALVTRGGKLIETGSGQEPPAPVRARIRAFVIVPKTEAHSLPRFLRKH